VQFAERGLPYETGGILVGHRESNDIVVAEVLAVPAESAGTSHYRRDSTVADAVLQHYLQTSDDLEGYVGEWHSHPAPAGPSDLDERTIAEIASVSGGPVALIVCAFSRDQSRHNLHIRVARRKTRHRISTTIPVLRLSHPMQQTAVPDQEIRT
jgi:integrative and conjugative element protein (TIGR02256 family)